MAFKTSEPVGELCPGRATAGIAQIPGGEYIMRVSIYLRDRVDLDEGNRHILQEVGVFVQTSQLPCVMGGDWNMTPGTLNTSAFIQQYKGELVLPSEPSHYPGEKAPRLFDYFALTSGVSRGGQGCEGGGGFKIVSAQACGA